MGLPDLLRENGVFLLLFVEVKIADIFLTFMYLINHIKHPGVVAFCKKGLGGAI